MNSGVKLRNQYNETLDPTQPLPTDSVEAQKVTSVSETITYNGKAAAGAITINSTAQKAIVSVEGDQVASHWELEKNKVYEALVDSQAKVGAPRLQAVTETNGSADITVYDDAKDLEALFESATTTVKRFVAKVTDKDGNSLYGWIFGVAASSNVYTIDVVNNRLTETQNWVGTLGNFDNTSLQKVEIYRYNSPISFGTGTTLTEEVQCPREYSKSWEQVLNYAIRNLSNGQYFVDYMRGRIVGKKADATASETITYKVWVSTATSSGVSSAVELVDDGGATVAQDEDSAHVSGDPGFQMLTVRQDTPASSTSADGDYQSAKSDAKGYLHTKEGYAPKYEDGTAERAIIGKQPTINSDYTQSNKIFDGTAATVNVKATAGVLGGFTFWNSGAALLYVQFFNDANTAAGAQVPDLGSFPLPGTTGISIGADYFIANQHYFSTGIAVGISSTADDYTAHGTPSEVTGQINYS